MDRRIIAYSLNPLFWLTVALALLVNTLQAQSLGPQWLRSYGMNLLALPIYYYSASIFLKWITQDATRTLSKGDYIAIWILVSILFEWLLPQYVGGYVADAGDVLAYAAGGIIWYPLMNKYQLFTAFKRLFMKC